MSTNSSSSSSSSSRINEVIVAIVPCPVYSHHNQLFLLARIIASYNNIHIPIHFLCLAELNQELKLRVQSDNVSASNIHFTNLLLPEDSGLPSIIVLLKKLMEPVRRACIELSNKAKRLVIIYDTIMRDHIRDVHSLIPNVSSYVFHVGPAFNRYSMLRLSNTINHHDGIVCDDDLDKLVQQMQDEFPTLESSYGPNMPWFLRIAGHDDEFSSGEFMNSCREIEGKYLDLIGQLANTKHKKPSWALGPLHMLLLEYGSSNKTSTPRHECLEFLDKQDINSVIFVSFGTTFRLSQKQVSELALGLEQSCHIFIWVLREADQLGLPEGFEERVEGRGMVVRDWVPQLEILKHPSTGGFLSHCGWNSCIESISMGVPIAAWPILYDQPYNAILVTNLLKIGTSVRSWAQREELVTATAVEKVVKTLMGSPEGEEMRQRAVELTNKIKSSVGIGGVAAKEIESFISYIIK